MAMKHNLARHMAFALWVGCVLLGAAAVESGEAPKEQNAGLRIALSDNELNAFVKAYVEYQKIRLSYAPALENTKDPKEKKRIQDEANTKVRQTLHTHGLTPEQYNRIFASVNGDEELRKRVLTKVEEERKKS
jgi:ribonuclease I